MLTRTQTKHQILNHMIGCDHVATDDDVDLATAVIMESRINGERITTARICNTILDKRSDNKESTVTIYINHNNPAKYRDLQMQLIQSGIAGQDTAMNVAQQIIDYRQTTWGGHNFVHLGA